jgi:hypothetical protein
MDKTFAAIEKLKEVELELHRLKNHAEMMNRSVEAQREWQGLTDEEMEAVANSVEYNPLAMTVYEYRVAVQKATAAKLKEKNT